MIVKGKNNPFFYVQIKAYRTLGIRRETYAFSEGFDAAFMISHYVDGDDKSTDDDNHDN